MMVVRRFSDVVGGFFWSKIRVQLIMKICNCLINKYGGTDVVWIFCRIDKYEDLEILLQYTLSSFNDTLSKKSLWNS